MKIKISICALFVSLCLQVYGQSTQQVVHELMEKSGSTSLFKQLDNLLYSKLEEKRSSFKNDEDFKTFVALMKTGINSMDAEKYFVDYFELKTNEDSLKKVIALYNEPLMIEMTLLEVSTNDPSQQQDQQSFFEGLKKNPPSQTRIQQLVLLNNELGTSELLSKMFTNMALSMAKGFNSVQPAENQVPLNELKEKIQSTFNSDFSIMMTNQIIALSMYTYKSVDDSKLNEYIKVWQSPVGKYFVKNTYNALDYSFSKMFEQLGSSMKIFDKSK